MPYLLDANGFIQAKPGSPRGQRVGWWEPALWSRLLSGFLGLANRPQCLVAHALAHGHTFVTREIASNSTKKIKIPDACIDLGIKCMTRYEMLRRNSRVSFWDRRNNSIQALRLRQAPAFD